VNPSIAVDVLGTVHVSFLDRTNRYYRYARRADGIWTGSDIASSRQNPAATPYGQWSAIVVDGAGVPSVSYHQSDVAYFLARGDGAGTSWTTTEIGFSEAAWAFLGHNAIAVDPENASSVHVAVWLYNSAAGYLPACWKPGDSSAVRVDGPLGQDNASRNGIHTAIAVDPSGRPHLSFLRGEVSPGTKTYWTWAEPNGSGWTLHDVEETSVPGTYQDERLSAIAVDASGRPHLFYALPTSGPGSPRGYRYATWNGASWTVETVAQPPPSGLSALALALDASGVPHVAFYGVTSKVTYAKRTGPGTWSTQVVDASSHDTGDGVAIAVDADGGVHIAYHDATAGTLEYATR
jgi:hypothetical protein